MICFKHAGATLVSKAEGCPFWIAFLKKQVDVFVCMASKGHRKETNNFQGPLILQMAYKKRSSSQRRTCPTSGKEQLLAASLRSLHEHRRKQQHTHTHTHNSATQPHFKAVSPFSFFLFQFVRPPTVETATTLGFQPPLKCQAMHLC